MSFLQKIGFYSSALMIYGSFNAQVVNTGMTNNYDSLEMGKLVIGGQVDTYYGFDFDEPVQSLRPYTVSSARHNEININLAFIDLKYMNERVRAHLVPGFGTYINDNYAAEKGSLKNLVEANAGVRISKNKNIWIDAGILGSPFTNETTISKEHLTYTRSLASEYSPYYVTGVKLSVPVNKKWNAYFYVLNGWQQIQDNNNPLSLATQVEYRPNKNLLLNWDTYIGNEYSEATPDYRTRYFSDIYLIYRPTGKWSVTSCAYAGIQEKKDSLSHKSRAFWAQANIVADYRFGKRSSVSARAEYFYDPESAIVTTITSANTFDVFSASAGYNLRIMNNAIFRLEYRYFYSDHDIYLRHVTHAVNYSNLLITNLTVWF